MIKRSKKIISGIFAAAATLCTVFGISVYDAPVRATADSDASVDALGNLQWSETVGATAYEVSSDYGTLTTDDAKANVGEMLTKAAKEARANGASEASVTFKVTPILDGGTQGTAATYTHTFARLIDMDYTTHDITDYYAPAANGLETPLKKDTRLTCYSSSYKNDLLTLGLQGGADKNGNVLGWGGHLQLFCNTVAENTYTNMLYDIHIQNNSVKLRYGDKSVVSSLVDAGGIANTTIDGYGYEASDYKIPADTPHYIQVGVFDTYNLDGTKAGETVYYTCSYLDGAELITNQSLCKFLSVDELAAAGITDASYEMEGGAKLSGATLARANLGFWPYSDTAFDSYIFSGNLPNENKPTGLYYDNVDGTFNWNTQEGATAYQWTDGNNAWKTVTGTSVDVVELITKYQDEYTTTGKGDLRLRVRAIIEGKATAEAVLKIDVTQFQKERSTKVDIADVMSSRFVEVTSPTEMIYKVESQYTDRGWAYSKGSSVKANTYVTLAFKTNILPTSASGNILNVNFFGDLWNGGVWLSVINNGRVAFSNHCETPTAEKKNYWLARNILPAFEAGKKYYVTFGVDEIYDLSGKQTAQRYTARFEVETQDGFDRRTLGVLTYDNTQYAKEGLETNLVNNPYELQLWLGGTDNSAPRVTYGSYGGSEKYADKVNTVAVSVGDSVFVEQLAYGDTFDFTEYATRAYEGFSIVGWKYSTDQTTYKPFTSVKGWWNIDSPAIIRADLSYKLYNISYSIPSDGALSGVTNATDNPSSYTKQTPVLLNAPENIPVGYLFDGWYEESDVQKQHRITSLEDYSGDLRLVAAFKLGYTVSVETTETVVTEWKVGDAQITLVAPEIEGKTFEKWQVWNGSAYVDYTGESTFTPNDNMKIKAVYVTTTYSITYVADGATHANAQSYTAETLLTFAKAEKAGSVFCGWYTDEALTSPIADTQGRKENLTLYAGFIDSGEVQGKVFVNAQAQVLPVLVLPSGCSYTVALFENGSETPLSLSNNNAYIFNEVGKQYVISYKITSPFNENVSKNILITVENEQSTTDVPPEDSTQNENGDDNGKTVWIIVGCVAGLLVVGGVVVVVCRLRKGKDE